jgi:DNA transformation protein
VRRGGSRSAADGGFVVTAQDSMREWLEGTLGALPEFSVRRLFGGAGLYSEDTVFGLLHRSRLYFKVDDATRPDFVARGSEVFEPREGVSLSSYQEVPADILDDEEQLLEWARRSLMVAEAQAQVPKARGHVPPEEILAGHPPAIRALCEKLRGIVRAAAPDAREAGYRGWHLIGYRSPHYFCFIAPLPEHVRLGFEHGHRLSDPDGLLEPMGKQVYFVRLTPSSRIPVSGIRRLIGVALETLPLPR